jgi:secreted trypsin-like serine protease
LTIYGWGNRSRTGADYPQQLQEATLERFPDSVCAGRYGRAEFTAAWHLCIGRRDGAADACEGDSGSPLIATIRARPVVVGVVSRGPGCQQPGLPSIATRVRRFHRWLSDASRAETPRRTRRSEPHVSRR